MAFLIFAVFVRHSRMMTANTNLFIILWIVASFIVVFGVVYFRDKETTVGNPADTEATRSHNAE